jgi:hypothetical protein
MLWACCPQSCLFVQVLDIVIIAKDEEARPLNLNITYRKEAQLAIIINYLIHGKHINSLPKHWHLMDGSSNFSI